MTPDSFVDIILTHRQEQWMEDIFAPSWRLMKRFFMRSSSNDDTEVQGKNTPLLPQLKDTGAAASSVIREAAAFEFSNEADAAIFLQTLAAGLGSMEALDEDSFANLASPLINAFIRSDATSSPYLNDAEYNFLYLYSVYHSVQRGKQDFTPKDAKALYGMDSFDIAKCLYGGALTHIEVKKREAANIIDTEIVDSPVSPTSDEYIDISKERKRAQNKEQEPKERKRRERKRKRKVKKNKMKPAAPKI